MSATLNRYKTTRPYPADVADRIVARIPTWARSVQMLHEDDGSARFRAHRNEWVHVVRAVRAAVTLAASPQPKGA